MGGRTFLMPLLWWVCDTIVRHELATVLDQGYLVRLKGEYDLAIPSLVWPFEIIVLPKPNLGRLEETSRDEKLQLGTILRDVTRHYDDIQYGRSTKALKHP